MSESGQASCREISQELFLQRLEQSEELREFAIQTWLQNPHLAKQAGARIIDLLKPISPTWATFERR